MPRLPAPPLPRWLRALLPAELRRASVQVGDLNLHVMELGEPGPRPSILMVHGNPTWGFLYRKVAELVDRREHVVIPDLVGLGLSDKPHEAAWHTLDRHGEALAGLVRRLDLGRVILVAQDWGGPIGLRALVDEPERLAGLVLMNTAVGPPAAGFRPTAFHRFARLPVVSDLAFRGLGFPQIALHLAQGDRGSIRGEVARAYRYPLRGADQRIAPLALARMVPDRLEHPSVPALRRTQALVEGFRGPAALVWGERDPILGRLCNRIHRLLPQAAVTRTRAGHFLQEEVPLAIAAALAGVIARVA